MRWRVREATVADVPAVAAVFRRSREAALPWLPVLHTPEEDLAYFEAQIRSADAAFVVDAGTILGFAIASAGWLNHCYVDSELRGKGIGTALLAVIREREPGAMQLWAFQRNHAAREFYARHGWREAELTDGASNEEREPDVRMTIAAAGQPVQVREATIDDAEQIARVHTTTWQVAYRGMLPDDFLDLLDWRVRRDNWLARLSDGAERAGSTLVAESSGSIIGFAVVGPPRDGDLESADPPVLEMYAIYVDPAHWGHGVGSALWRSARNRLDPAVSGVALWVLSANATARAYYERMGFVLDGATRVEDIGGRMVGELRYRWTATRAPLSG